MKHFWFIFAIFILTHDNYVIEFGDAESFKQCWTPSALDNEGTLDIYKTKLVMVKTKHGDKYTFVDELIAKVPEGYIEDFRFADIYQPTYPRVDYEDYKKQSELVN